MLARRGPFRLAEKRQEGRVTANKVSATSLLVWQDGSNSVTTCCGTADGQLICIAPQTRNQVLVLKPKRAAVVKMIKIFQNTHFLALCGGELFCLEAHTFKRIPLSLPGLNASTPVLDVCVNQRGPPDWGLCVVTQDWKLHLFCNFSGTRFEPLRQMSCPAIATTPANAFWGNGFIQTCWYENIICLGASTGVLLLDDDFETTGVAPKRIPIDVSRDNSTCCTILPLPDGQLLVSTGALGVLVDLSGNPIHNQAVISYSSPPQQMICTGPYIATVFESNRVDIARTNAPALVIQRLILANIAPCLASVNPYLFGELLYVVEGGAIPCAFAIGLAQQHSETPFRLAEPLPLQNRLQELIATSEEEEEEEEVSITSRVAAALSLVSESFPPACMERKREMELHVYLLAGKACLREDARAGTSVALEYFLQAETSPLQFLNGDERSLMAALLNPRDVLQYTRRWRKLQQEQGKEMSEQVDTALVKFLCRTDGEREALQEFCLDETNACDIQACLEEMDGRSEFDLAATHLRSMRCWRGSKEDDNRGVAGEEETQVLLAYVKLDEPEFFANVLLRRPSSSTSSADNMELVHIPPECVPWMLAKYKLDSLVEIFKRYGAQFAQQQQSMDKMEAMVLDSGVARPRYLLALLGREALARGEKQDAPRFAKQVIAALQEAVLANEPKPQDLTEMLREVVQNNSPELATMCLDELQRLDKKSFAMERIDCFQALSRHDEALRVYVFELKDLVSAEAYSCRVDADGSALTSLLRILLELDVGKALDLLNRNATRVNALDALHNLPATVSVRDAHEFLQQAIRKGLEMQRNTRMEQNLARSAHFKSKLALLATQRQYVELTSVDRCSRCDNKFTLANSGGGGIVRQTDGSVQHINCPPPPRPTIRSTTTTLTAMDQAVSSNGYKQLQ